MVSTSRSEVPLPQLMHRYCCGDERAFYELYDALAPALLHYLIGLARDRARAEDLLQTTFLKLHTHRDVYVAGADPTPWVYAIAKRAFIDDHRRRGTARRFLARAGGDDTSADLTGAPADAGAAAPDPDLVSRAVAALATLPRSQRDAVRLTKLEGLSIDDAARAAHTTPGAIKQRVHRGYQKLRAVLGAAE